MSSFRSLIPIFLCAAVASPASGEDYQVGLAKIDITPTGPIWMSGYGNRKKPSQGVDTPLFAKALTIRDGTAAPLVLVTADIIGFPRDMADGIAKRLEKAHQLPRANLMLVASHTHTGPVIDSNLWGMFDLKGKDAEAVRDYAQTLQDRIVAVVGQALEKPAPARLSLGHTRASFAVNRRVFRPGGVNFGVNPDGPSDHDVPVLRIDDPKGAIRAIVFGYACHCTTLGGDHYRIGGDWAGFAQEYLERAHPGALAFFVTGCGADQNPEPRGNLDFARQNGLEMAGAVCRAVKERRTSVSGTLHAAFDHAALPFGTPPNREEWQKRLKARDAFTQRHARHFLAMLDRGDKLPTSYPCPVQAWQFGKDLTLVALGGEVVVDYAYRLKRELRGGNLWIAGYSNDVFAYVPSVRILLEGGYEADYNLIFYGQPTRFSNQVEDVLVKKVHEVAQKVR